MLIAILLPVLSKARAQAQQVVCASNMRQIGLAAIAYSQENGNILPIPAGIPRTPPLPYDALVQVQPGILDFQTGTLWSYLGSGIGARQRIFTCPADSEPRLRQSDQGNGDLVVGTTRNFTYCFNGMLNVGHGGPVRLWYGVRLNQVHRPTQKLMVVECEGPSSPNSPITNASGTNGVLVLLTKRHHGLCNVCYFDGHVELLNPKIFNNPAVGGWVYTDTPSYEHYVDIFVDF